MPVLKSIFTIVYVCDSNISIKLWRQCVPAVINHMKNILSTNYKLSSIFAAFYATWSDFTSEVWKLCTENENYCPIVYEQLLEVIGVLFSVFTLMMMTQDNTINQ